MKKKNKKNTRIYDWFAGISDGIPVIFKFTYNWDIDKQVIVKSDTYVKKMSLNTFKNTVKPVKIDCKFISVSE